MIPAVLQYTSPRESRLFLRAVDLVSCVPPDYLLDPEDGVSTLRCHELARAVNIALEDPQTEVQDGWFHTREHSWIWTHPFPEERPIRTPLPKILDVYQPGTLPQVVLLDFSNVLVWYRTYVWNAASGREDINVEVVKELLGFMRS